MSRVVVDIARKSQRDLVPQACSHEVGEVTTGDCIIIHVHDPVRVVGDYDDTRRRGQFLGDGRKVAGLGRVDVGREPIVETKQVPVVREADAKIAFRLRHDPTAEPGPEAYETEERVETVKPILGRRVFVCLCVCVFVCLCVCVVLVV